MGNPTAHLIITVLARMCGSLKIIDNPTGGCYITIALRHGREGGKAAFKTAVFPLVEVVLGSHYTYKRICMVAFMEESSIEARKGYYCGQNGSWDHLAGSLFGSGPLPHHELPGRQLHDSLTDECRFSNRREVYLIGTATRDFLERGGDAATR